MKRKFLSILLTLAMALTLLPTAAMAEGEEVSAGEGGESTPTVEYVAQVGAQGYETLAEAIEKAADGATVTLLKDAELTETLNITKAITLDGANHKITGKPSTGKTSFITVKTDGDFTMKNATILPTSKVEKNSAIDLQVKGKVVVDNCVFGAADDANQFMYNGLEFSQSRDYPMADGTTISNCTFYGGSFRHNFISFYRMAEGATININGNKFLNTNWDTTNAIRVSNYSNVNATINLLDDTYNDHGADENKDYAGLLFFQELPTYNDNFTKLTVNIKNLDTTGAQSNQLFYVYKDSIISTNQPVVKGDRSVEKFFVAKVGDTYYKTLAEAVAAADNATVTLLKDVTTNVTIPADKTITLDLNGKNIKPTTGDAIVNKGNLTIVGNGEVAAQNSESAAIANFPGAAANLNGGTYSSSNWYVIKNLGTMTIDGPVTVKKPDGSTDTSSLIDNGWVNGSDKVANEFVTAQADKAKLTIKNGAFEGKSGSASCSVVKNDDYGVLEITGGTFDSTSNTGTSNATTILNWNVATISGGTFKGSYPISNGSYNNEADHGLLTISGGNFTGTSSLLGQGQGGTSGAGKLTITDGNFNASQFGVVNYAIEITGGLFSSDPSAYVAAEHYVDASNNGDYPYTVKEGTKPAGALIVVKDKTDTAVSGDIAGADKTAINNVIDKANVDGVAEAVAPAKKADIVSKSNANPGDNDKVEIEVAVKVEAKAADLANGKLTFEASPVATVKVNGTATDTTVPVTNDMLNGKPITVKLPLPTVDGKLFTPKQILHKFTGGGYEYFINATEGSKRGAQQFTVENGCAVFTIYGFSTFELSGTVTYVEPSSGGGSSSSSRRYDVSAPSVKHGDVTVSPKSASKGDTVTITVKPDSGYELDTLTVKDASGSKIKVKDKGDGKFTFTMPASKVTVSAEFAEIETLDFADVSTDAYYYEAVKWAAKKGITGGTGDGTFNPNGSCTRAHIVTFLWRAAGSPEPKSTVSFADVPADSYYAKAVAWAVENGITLGTGDGTFSPNATCTRAQSVTFLYRALGTAPTTVNGFTDVTTDAFYADAVAWAVESGVTNGTSASTFSPNNGCTRAQIVTFLYRTMK